MNEQREEILIALEVLTNLLNTRPSAKVWFQTEEVIEQLLERFKQFI